MRSLLSRLQRMLRSSSQHNNARRAVQQWTRRNRSLSRDAEAFESRLLLTTIYYESFESGLGAEWSLTEVHADSRVQIRDLAAEGVITNPASIQFTTNGNNHALVFDSTNASGDGIDDLGLATVSVDLTGYSDAVLTFHQFELDDENTSLPDQHSTTTAGDGLAVSRNGSTWYTLKNLEGADINRGGDGRWQLHEYDLGLEFARINSSFGAGLSFDSNVQFKFSQYDNTPLSNDGWAIDEFLIADQAGTFDINRPRGAFHRFNLAGENDNDFYYRAAVYGTPDANTPIINLIHGSNGDTNYNGYAWRWHNFVSDPANGIDSVILVMPAFVEDVARGRFNTPVRYASLSWNTVDDAAADLALLETVDAITSTGIGDGNGIYLWGFSAGGQFIGRFAAAHPDRVAAAVVGGPASQVLPVDHVSFGYGVGQNGTHPLPAGVDFDIPEILKTRMMYWVGQEDNDPNHPDLSRNPAVDSVQGLSRLERSINQFEVMHREAAERGLSANDYEYELHISEGDGHGWSSSDIPEIVEFMFREHDVAEQSVKLHPRIVRTPSVAQQQDFLPQNVTQLDVDDTFHIELWAEPPANATLQSGVVDMYFDTTLADMVGITHGAFASATTGSIDEAAGRLRNFGGTFSGSSATNAFQLFGRIEMKATAASVGAPTRLMLALQRTGGTEFNLTTGATRTDFQPFESVYLGGTAQGIGNGAVQGTVFGDNNANQSRQPAETGLADYYVQLTDPSTGSPVTGAFSIEPDDAEGSGAYLTDVNPWVTLSAFGSEPINAGVRAGHKGTDESSTGSHVFVFNRADGSNSQWVENLRSLRMDFSAPTSEVTIDIIAKLGDARDIGRLEVYGADGSLLEVLQTADLANAEFETVTITRSQADIAFAVATGVGSNRIRLDNLRFKSLLRQQTDANGEFHFADVAAGNYSVVANNDASFPSGTNFSVDATVQQGVLTASVDVPVDIAPPGEPDLKATAFNAVSDHLLSGGHTNVTFTVTNAGESSAGLFQTHVIHSFDGILGNADDVVVANTVETFAGLTAGTSASRTIGVQLDQSSLFAHARVSNPTGLSVGTVSSESSHLFLVVDFNNSVVESDESNNSGQGAGIDRDNVTYFPWDKNRNGTVEPLEALSTIRAIGSDDVVSDFDGNGMVTPLEALSAVERIGYVRASVLSKVEQAKTVTTSALKSTVVPGVLDSGFGSLSATSNGSNRIYGLVSDDDEASLFAAEPGEIVRMVATQAEEVPESDSEPFTSTGWLDVI